MNKRKLILTVIALMSLTILSFFVYKKYLLDPQKEIYKEAMSYVDDGGGIYTCSKPIKVKVQKVPESFRYPSGERFLPVDQAEAKLFCHSSGIIENEGKIKVLQKPEVLSLINKYEYKDVTITALEFKYIKDKNFVNRLLPAYKNRDIGCIIVVETPGEKKVYLEDESLETFEELDYKTFEQLLAKVSPADRRLFTENLH